MFLKHCYLQHSSKPHSLFIFSAKLITPQSCGEHQKQCMNSLQVSLNDKKIQWPCKKNMHRSLTQKFLFLMRKFRSDELPWIIPRGNIVIFNRLVVRQHCFILQASHLLELKLPRSEPGDTL